MQLFEGEEPEFDELSLNFTIDELREALIGGYGEEATKLQWGTPDAEMVRHLYRNVYQFSVAKNFTQMRTLTSALIDEEGHTRSFSDFMNEAAKIDKKFNVDYLRAEYYTAINSAEMASHWVRFNQMGDPMLRYVTVGDERVRASHAAMNGIQRPMSDPIWDKIYPPNGWNCRCTVVTTTGAATPSKQIRMPWDVPPLFQTNLAKTGMLWPKGHPYFKDITSRELGRALEYIDPDSVYYDVKTEAGNTIEVSYLHKKTELYQNLKTVDILLSARQFKNAKLLPDFHEKEQTAKRRYIPVNEMPADHKRTPDALLDGHTWELKHPKPHNVSANVNKAAGQSRRVVVRISDLGDKTKYGVRRSLAMNVDWTKIDIVKIIWPNGEIEDYIQEKQ